MRKIFSEEIAKIYADMLASNNVRWIGRRLNPEDQFGQLIIHERKILRKFLREESGKLLDVGAGYGRLIPFYKEMGFNVVAVEPDPGARAILIEKGVEVYDANITRLPFESCEFDVLTLILVIHEVLEADRIEALRECHRVLRKKGLMIVGEHRTEGFDPDWLLEVLPNLGFMVEEINTGTWRFGQIERERVLLKCRKVK